MKEMTARRRDLSFGRSKSSRPFVSALKLNYWDFVKSVMTTLELAEMDTLAKNG